MTALRHKMIKVMQLQNLANETQRNYLQSVKGLARYYQKSPDTIIKEMTTLKPDDIDSKRMLIKVQGKGGKQRYMILSKKLLEGLRRYYKHLQPKIYLFPSSFKTKKHQPITYQTAYTIYEKARKKAGIIPEWVVTMQRNRW